MEEFSDRFYQSWGRVNAAYHDYARRCGLNDADIWVYYLLYSSQEGCAQSDICRITALPKQTVNSAVVRARKAGHVAVRPNPADARSKVLMLTAEGRQFAGPIVARLQAAERAAGVSFTGEQLLQAIAALDAIAEQVERLDGGCKMRGRTCSGCSRPCGWTRSERANRRGAQRDFTGNGRFGHGRASRAMAGGLCGRCRCGKEA